MYPSDNKPDDTEARRRMARGDVRGAEQEYLAQRRHAIEALSGPQTLAPRKSTATDALAAAHAEAHRLIEKLTAKVDSIHPDTANWGHVGDLNYYVQKLAEMVGEVG